MVLLSALGVHAIAPTPTRAQVPMRSVPDSAEVVRLEAQLMNRPSETRLYVALARAYDARGEPEQAERLLRDGLSRAADRTAVRWALVQHLADRREWRAALREIEPLVAAGDSVALDVHPRLLVNAGFAALEAGDTIRARTRWERALTASPGSRIAAINLGQLLLRSGRTDSARTVFARALRHHPEDDRLRYLHAMTLEGESGLREAIEATRRLYEADPGNEAIALQLAGLHRTAGQREAAGELYRALLDRPEPSEAVYAAAAGFWLGGGLYEQTVQLLDEGLERYPLSGRLWTLMGEAEAGREEWDNAVVAYSQAVVHLDDPVEAKLAMADVHVSAGDTAAAVDVLRGIDRDARGRVPLLRAARTAEDIGAPDLARRIYDALLGRDARDLAALEGAGRAAESVGDTAAAVGFYRRAMARDSVGPEPPLGLIRLTRPGPDSAAVLLRRAAWRGLERLGQVEMMSMAAVRGPADARRAARAQPILERQAGPRETVAAVLDTMVLETDWGPSELERLQDGFPDAAILDRYAARLAARQGRDSTALAMTRDLIRRFPEAVELHRDLARLIERIRGPEAALDAWRHALELEPDHEPTFRAALAAHREAGRLEVNLPSWRSLANS
ncbi:MAG: tetratricopeptide repeat protein, partial [Gemmatimonadota bacterium]